MVVAGDFSVRLVEAETKVPFKEHVGANKTTYAEVEPEAEYFVEVEYIGEDMEGKVRVECLVDGVELGTYSTLNKSDPPYLIGLSSRENGVYQKKAWRFAKPTTTTSAAATLSSTEGGRGTAGPSGMVMGRVKVRMFDEVDTGTKKKKRSYKNPPTFSHGFKPAKPAPAPKPKPAEPRLTLQQEKKKVRSVEGSATLRYSFRPMSTSAAAVKKAAFVPKVDTTRNVHMKGELLQEIEIIYCTTLGLIYEGVLPKPPLWAIHRMENQARNDRGNFKPMEDMSAVPLKKIKFEARYDGTTQICPAKEMDLYDLTNF